MRPAQPPIGDGDLLDEDLLQRTLGSELVVQIQQQGIELLLAFRPFAAVDDDLLGQKAVFETVAGGDGLTGRREGTGRLGGIAAVARPSGLSVGPRCRACD